MFKGRYGYADQVITKALNEKLRYPGWAEIRKTNWPMDSISEWMGVSEYNWADPVIMDVLQNLQKEYPNKY
jgi:hypothetical protein